MESLLKCELDEYLLWPQPCSFIKCVDLAKLIQDYEGKSDSFEMVDEPTLDLGYSVMVEVQQIVAFLEPLQLGFAPIRQVG